MKHEETGKPGSDRKKKKRKRSSENYPNEIEVYELSDKQFKISIIKMLYRLKKMRHEQN